ncbi:hypothetical protein EJ04DRAFT_519347 [Polyplosphaeria fusca]|uniref:BZIP domain-containing protein n=1 Tax=Polyplosphaeria fusca TaxID=682080 RepID=A0A9P4V4L7_9PLEO|nr:hypothetical protein EJ04DRAFT_519347 [Polyplosphaeria fusca]
MPAEKRKKAEMPAAVPEIGDPDRKRVLNVLAQRRYRERQREKIAALEAQTKLLSPRSDHIASSEQATANQPGVPGSDAVEIEQVNELDSLQYGDNLVGFDTMPLDMSFFGDIELCDVPSSIPSTSKSSDPSTKTNPSSSTLPSAFNFPLTPDGMQIEVPLFATMRAFATIATILNVTDNIFNPTAIHTLSSIPHPSLPPNLHPTPAQVVIPHHPLFDTLPWPSVREKLICMFALPPAFRPSIAQGDMGEAIQRLTLDLDDSKDGIRVHGNMAGWTDGNEMTEECWEVGERFYKNWWWSMEPKVIEISNRRRKERGLGALRLL